MALAKVEAEEAKHRQDVAESGDGQVFEYGKPGEDKDDELTDGETE
jgi:hypothetical protein